MLFVVFVELSLFRNRRTRMRVMIFGAGGALANQLVLAMRGHDVVQLGHKDCDITDAYEVMRVVQKHRPTHIINAAAFNVVDKAEEDDRLAVAVNGTAAGHIARAAAVVRAIMVHYSTDYIFDGKKPEGYREDDAPNPINKYGRSKLSGEQELEKVKSSVGLSYYCIRTSRLFGPIGTAKSSKKNFVDIMIERAQAGQDCDVIDAEVSSPTYTPDLAAATVRCLKERWPFGTYHLTNSGACTRFACAKEIFAQWALLTGKPQPTINPIAEVAAQGRAPRPAYAVLLNTKTPTMRPWQEAVGEYLQVKCLMSNV